MSQHKLSDFHNLVARFKIPLAPVFLSKPTRPTVQVKAEDADELSSSSETEEKPQTTTKKKKSKTSADESTKEYGSNGALEAVNQTLASLLMRYIPSLGAVLVACLDPPTFLLADGNGGLIRRPATTGSRIPLPTLPGNAWGVMDVEVKLLGWRPTIGQKLIGRPTNSTPSQLSLVIYRTFNASINANHLRAAGYHYDLNFEFPANWDSIGHPATPQDPSLPFDLTDQHRHRGCWVDANGVVVGGDEGTVSFTVMSLMIENHMISVMGSLLDDPFSIDEGPVQAMVARPMPKRRASDREAAMEGTSSEESDEEGWSGKAASRGRMRAPPEIHSAAASRARPDLIPPLVPTTTSSSSITTIPPPPLTATNLQALNSALQPEPIGLPPATHPPVSTQKSSSKKPSIKKPRKRPAASMEDKPASTLNPLPTSSSALPTLHNPAPASSINSSRKKKIKTSTA